MRKSPPWPQIARFGLCYDKTKRIIFSQNCHSNGTTELNWRLGTQPDPLSKTMTACKAKQKTPNLTFLFAKTKQNLNLAKNYPVKIELEEIEKLENDLKWCENSTSETWYWKVMKNIWSVEHILFCKWLDFQAKTQSWKRQTKRWNDPKIKI